MAQIDSSIALNVRAPQLEDPTNAMLKLMQLQGMQGQQQLAQYSLKKAQRDDEDNNALRSALSAPGADVGNALLRLGRVKEYNDFQKGQTEQTKTKAETEKTQIETNIKKIGLGAQILSTARDQASYDQARAVAQANGLDVANMPPQFDPAFVQGKLNEALTIKDQLEQQWKAKEYTTPKADAVLQAQTSRENNKRSVGAQFAIAQSNRDAANINAQGTRDAAKTRYDQDTEMKLGDDYRAQSKPFKEVSDAYKTITTSLEKATTSPAATLAGATKFMKLLDPGSVVRESELGMALAATGVFDRAMNYHNTLLKGKVLTAQQAADFKNIAGQIYQAAQQQQQMLDKDYTTKAETYKLRPGMVVQDLGQNAKPAAAPSAAGLPDGWSVKVK
jgi:hypothetical protein